MPNFIVTIQIMDERGNFPIVSRGLDDLMIDNEFLTNIMVNEIRFSLPRNTYSYETCDDLTCEDIASTVETLINPTWSSNIVLVTEYIGSFVRSEGIE